MAENSAIEWTDHTHNDWMGCTAVGPGCDHCYAQARMDTRLHVVRWGAGEPRKRTSLHNRSLPFVWQRQAPAFFKAHGRRQRVFSASLSDWLDNEVPIEWLVDLLDTVRQTPDLDWLLLTKRIGNWKKRLESARTSAACTGRIDLAAWIGAWLDGQPPANAWVGATVVNQLEADRDIPKLLAVPARVRFLSMEPLLGEIDLRREHWGPEPRTAPLWPEIDWVIVGGESGHGARPMHPQWARTLRDQCAAAGVPFLFKQWGEWGPEARLPEVKALKVHDSHRWSIEPGEPAGGAWSYRIGKKAAGRLLDGQLHDGFPLVAHA